MKISDSSITLHANHSKIQHYSRKQSLRIVAESVGPAERGLTREGVLDAESVGRVQSDPVTLAEPSPLIRRVQVDLGEATEELSEMEDLNIRILRALFERLFGKRIRMPHLAELKRLLSAEQEAPAPEEDTGVSDRRGWGLVYSEFGSYYESEQLEFTGKGTVLTDDGQELSIEVNLNLSRELSIQEQFSLVAGEALKDPLVVNFSGPAAELTQTKFSFDIDADGIDDQISFVGPGSGFLAVDGNGDGVVNSGAELFGALTGDGFAELSGHDDDGNGWIDENDDIYSRLRIWTRDEAGVDQLFALGDKGVGALYLGNVRSPFSITSHLNELQAQVRSTGIFLSDEGQVGTLQQLDLVV